MRRLAWVMVATLALLGIARSASAQGEPVKPYIVFVMDVSGSMGSATGFGRPSCVPGTMTPADTRLDHAKCAINNIANSYGDMVMALGRFRLKFRDASPDLTCGDGCSDLDGINCDPDGDEDGCTQDSNQTTGCTDAMANGDRFEVLVPILEGNQSALINWSDFNCADCNANGAEPEILANGYTPIAGSLVGAKRYWQGLASPTEGAYWTGPGDDPIVDDPLATVFTSPGNQCRPYITIMMTDGDETCARNFNQATAAATSMLTTAATVGGVSRNYRIVTKPIGFGKPPGDAEIEALAHAGGATDVANQNEGAYAQNEEELQLEISQIIADAIKQEACNGEDDDCDILVDEDFPELGDPCFDNGIGNCRGSGEYVCNDAETGVRCDITDPGGTGTSETCDGEDDDCDGSIDENACTSCGDVEICNNRDDDCDTRIDENLVRDCGTDVGDCTRGTQSCSAGVWGTCSGIGPAAETCNREDDDCDGTVDGFAEECWSAGNPGADPDSDDGECRPGTRVCPPAGNGQFQPCIGGAGPTTEACDLLDNDCDETTDEDTGGGDCSSTCGVGEIVCRAGVLECDSSGQAEDEVCNNFDDDCDTRIDEGLDDLGDCTTGEVCGGQLVCMGGVPVCIGDPIRPEICDCGDNDCDTRTDEEPPALCAAGATCVPGACQCAFPCGTGEFPCAEGRTCVEVGEDRFCLVDPCYQVTCGPDGNGDATECVDGACVRTCDHETCPNGFVCIGATGECEPDDCRTFPDRCTGDELCVAGECVSDPCAAVSCGDGEYCFEGDCVTSCTGVSCPAGERCRLGSCERDPCGAPCVGNAVCDEDTGECVTNPCLGRNCQPGEACDPQTGQCAQDPCLGVTCPNPDDVCVGGSCGVPVVPTPDAGIEDRVTAAGGGGCSSGGEPAGPALAGLLIALAAWTRRRRSPGLARRDGGRS